MDLHGVDEVFGAEPVSQTHADPDCVKESPQDDDPKAGTKVVKEIDVFFRTLDPKTQLYLLQYPPYVQPHQFDERCLEVRLNPETSEGEFDLSTDLESQSHDIAQEFANKLNITKQTYCTSGKPSPANGCFIGILIGDKLHLYPLHANVKLQPSLKHLKVEGSSEEKSAATSKEQMEPSIVQRSDGDERWVPLKYYGCKSDISTRYLQEMVAQESETRELCVD